MESRVNAGEEGTDELVPVLVLAPLVLLPELYEPELDATGGTGTTSIDNVVLENEKK